MQAKLRAEEAKRAALEAEQKASKEAAEREAAEASKRISARVSKDQAPGHQMDGSSGTSNAQPKGSVSVGTNKSQSAGIYSVSTLTINSFLYYYKTVPLESFSFQNLHLDRSIFINVVFVIYESISCVF